VSKVVLEKAQNPPNFFLSFHFHLKNKEIKSYLFL
jgi:hypothetical protein